MAAALHHIQSLQQRQDWPFHWQGHTGATASHGRPVEQAALEHISVACFASMAPISEEVQFSGASHSVSSKAAVEEGESALQVFPEDSRGQYVNKVDFGLVKADLLANYNSPQRDRINVDFEWIRFMLGPLSYKKVRHLVLLWCTILSGCRTSYAYADMSVQ